MENIYLGRQPIIDTDSKQYSYEILYLDKNQNSDIDNDSYTSASAINSVLNKFGTKTFLGENKAFIKIDEKFLMDDLIFSIPKNFFIFSIIDTIQMNEKVVERVRQLKAKDYTLAINDTTLNSEKFEKYKPILKELSYLKTNIYENMGSEIKDIINTLKAYGVKVVATKINDNKQHKLAKSLGCELFQGYCFSKPKIFESKNNNANMFNVLKLYNMLIQDTDIDEIVSEFEKNHTLSVQLLQFINSGAFSFRNKISSIHHILTLVGRRPLAQWLMLMIYSKSVSSSMKASPLMLMVKNRTELMENLLRAIKPDVKSNALGEAYFVGVLSLIETIFCERLEDILDNIQVSDLTRAALLNDEGTLGKLYAVVREIEAFNIDAITEFANRYKLAVRDIQKVVLQSIENVNYLEQALAS